MKIVVMGTGGVGGYFGARLANAGYDVAFIARGKHLEAIKENGLKIISELGDIIIHPAKASNDPSDFEIADIVLFCVKSYDTESSSNLIKPLVGPKTAVIPFLNGIGHIEIMQRILGSNNVIGGVAAISALIEKPGVIRHNSAMQMLKFGEFNNEITPRIKAFQKACEESGINNAIPKNIECDLWQKIVMICTLAGANCLTRLPLGPCRSNPVTRTLMKNLAEEVVAVAKAENIILPDNQVEITMKQLDSLPEAMKASTLPALEKGEKLEASALNGAIDKLGTKHGINTYMHKAVYAALAPHQDGTPK
ncbi:MAG TPA: 2-dehydropantoate 2-reductase [Alphaproteobacteria bacterium]|nr:2-dehydropantoate 2-reductase [Alphaproteobacteria bacterium]